MKKYIDIGVNLTSVVFKSDHYDVVERAASVGVEKLVVTGTNIQHSIDALQLTAEYPGTCFSTAGLHPHHASEVSSDLISELKELLQYDAVVAMGECGLDFNRNYSPRNDQLKAFELQLELAADTGKPLFLHQRDAHEDFTAIIRSCRSELDRVVIHCFTGSVEDVEDYNELDLFIGVTGWICDERRGQLLQQSVRYIPQDRLLLETDSPYLIPRDLGKDLLHYLSLEKNRNEPICMPHIAKTVAQHTGTDEAKLVESAYQNSRTFFAI